MEWIKCSERMPNKTNKTSYGYQSDLVLCSDGEYIWIGYCDFIDNLKNSINKDGIEWESDPYFVGDHENIYWMILPKPQGIKNNDLF